MSQASGRTTRAADSSDDQPGAKRSKIETSTSSFLKSWTWKREHRPDRDRFHRPYIHTMALPASSPDTSNTTSQPPSSHPSPTNAKLTIEQAGFKGAEGFASTVWDSSIVVAKMLEAHPHLVAGRSVLDLSAGCGLVGLAAARLGAQRTVLTDLAPNLALLRRNADKNGLSQVEVLEHRWGEDVGPLGGPFDLVLACDVMYVEEAVQPLVASLAALARTGRGGGKRAIADEQRSAAGGHTGSGRPEGQGKPRKTVRQSEAAAEHDGEQGDDQAAATASRAARDGLEPVLRPCDKARGSRGDSSNGGSHGVGEGEGKQEGEVEPRGGAEGAVVYLAHGRNRFAEAAFWRCAGAAGFVWEELGEDRLHPDFQCSDVSVYRLVLRR